MDKNTENADSVESVDSIESFDMEGGLETISDDLFGKSDDVPHETDEDIEVEELASNEDEKQEAGKEPVITKEAPASWNKEMKEKFAELSPDVQDYMIQRESEMKTGLDVNKDDSTLGRNIRDIMSPYEAELKQVGVSNEAMIQNLMGAHYKLTTAPIEQRTQIMHQLAYEYGVQLTPAKEGGQQTLNPEVFELRKEINGLKYKLSEQDRASRQEAETKITTEVNEFAEKHEYFDEVSEQIVSFVNNGDTLEEAYEKAVWANPITRQKEIERVNKEKADSEMAKKMEKVRASKKAKSTNVSSRDTGKSPTGFLGSMEDTMRDTLREIQNRT